MPGLHHYLVAAAERRPDAAAVEETGGRRITYAELLTLSRRVESALVGLGVGPGDRVGIYLPKSIAALAAMHGAMLAGGAYVPADPTAPASRNATIHLDCGVRVTVISERFLAQYHEACGGPEHAPPVLIVPDDGTGPDMHAAMERLAGPASALAEPVPATQRTEPATAAASLREVQDDDLAYILYTSGSTGRPKGVMLSHRNATSFVEWCLATFEPTPEDRCSSHAPFHFDLSILDIYMAFAAGATLVLVSEDLGKEPGRLAGFIADRGLTIWYSAPSILALLVEFGGLQERDYGRLRLILFAGEVFPVKHLRSLKASIPHPAYYNLYGPTETNVCTFYRIPDEIDGDRTDPYPIGGVCSHLEAMVIDEMGRVVGSGVEGELVVRGPAVTRGYWNLPDRNARAFHRDENGGAWYRTGDIVVDSPDGYVFLGRRDRMVKKRGYRIELGEIEARLYEHPALREVAVVDVRPPDGDLQVVAFVVTANGERISIIALKRFCVERLPGYMVPDRFIQRSDLPHTSTDKIDYPGVRSLLAEA
jgi:amino acid adenylation domain-containing protein